MTFSFPLEILATSKVYLNKQVITHRLQLELLSMLYLISLLDDDVDN